MSSQDQRDTLDSLLDSLSDDEEIEKKMDDFARNKERIERIARARETSQQFQDTYSSSARQAKEQNASKSQSAGQVIDSTDDDEDYDEIPSFVNGNTTPFSPYEQTAQKAGMTRRFETGDGSNESVGGGTRVFSTAPGSLPDDDEDEEPIDGTREVRVGSDEIESLLQKDEPLLRREYVRGDDDDYDDEDFDDLGAYGRSVRSDPYDRRPARAPKRKRTNWRAIGIGAGIALTIALVGTAGYMVYNFIGSGQSSQVSKRYDELLEWAQNYASQNPDDAKKAILGYKSVYDKLSEDEKRQINEKLLAATGKTFDELLAEASAAEKPSAENSDVANAERKAQLKEQIKDLDKQISNLQNQLNSTMQRIQDAENKYNEKNNAATQAENERAAAQNSIDSLNNQISELNTRIASIPSEQADLQAQIDALNSHGSEADSSNTGNSGSNQAKISELRSQINALDSELESAKAKLPDLQRQLERASQDLSQAEDKASRARSEADTAYGAWQEIVNDNQPIQDEINSKTAERDQLQQEYDSIG